MIALFLLIAGGTSWPAPAFGATPFASFEHRMAQRYVDGSGDGFLDPANSASRVQASFNVILDACDSTGGGSPITSYRWAIDGDVFTTNNCLTRRLLSREGLFDVRLTVTTADGSSDSLLKQIRVKDLLVVSLGDSVASGEANPYRTEYRIDQDVRGVRVRWPVDATWEDERCHRSAVAGPAQAARHLELSSNLTSVTFVHLACSGAGIRDPIPDDEVADGGLLDPYQGIEPPAGEDPLPPQVDQVKELVGGRRIDAMLVSAGGNDVGFGDIVKDCLINFRGCHIDHEGSEDGVDIFEQRLPNLAPNYNRLNAELTEKLGTVLDPDDVYVSEYFDPTPDEAGNTCDPLVDGLVDRDEADWASKIVVAGMNDVIKRRVTTFGWNFVSGIGARFRGPPGHGYCAEPHWVARLHESLLNQADEKGSFHPCAPGQGAYRDELGKAVIDNLGLAVAPPTPGKDVVTGVKCTSPPEDFSLNRDGDFTLVQGVPAPIPDVIDNCPNAFNPDQIDGDVNFVGDVCQGFVVNRTGDAHDADLKDGTCAIVSPPSIPPDCTLRAAIEQANYKDNPDIITFSIATAFTIKGVTAALGGAEPIVPGSNLPQVFHPVTIDATTQPLLGVGVPGLSAAFRCAPWTGHPCVTLSGVGAQGCVACTGLSLNGHRGSQVKSLAVNDWSGVGIALTGAGAGVCDYGQHILEGNFIGTDVTGTEDLGNSFSGVEVNGEQNGIGGHSVRARNVISGNDGDGIGFFNAGGNVVAGNYIGTQVDGVGALGNSSDGVEVFDNFDRDLIGGTEPHAGNVIAHNHENGVYLYEGVGHRIIANSIHDNGRPKGLGIDIANCGVCSGDVTFNDPGDVDGGIHPTPNLGQNFPVIESVRNIGTDMQMRATLDSAPSTQFRLEFFRNSGCDPSRHGEGEKFIVARKASTGANGRLQIDVTVPGTLPAGDFITATAADPAGNTSEFSRAVGLGGPCIGTFEVNSAGDEEDGELDDDRCDTGSEASGFTGRCTLRAAMQEANHDVGRDRIRFAIGSGRVTISPASDLPPLEEAAVIDATTQPGYAGRPIVELNGSRTTSNLTNGLVVNGGDSVISGLVVNRFPNHGIVLRERGGNRITGSWVGLGLDGLAAPGNGGDGMSIFGSGANQVGGTLPEMRNVISGNSSQGIRIDGPDSDGNLMVGNFIGTDASGTRDRGNDGDGIFLNNGTGATIGGTATGARNVISGNGLHGVAIDAPQTEVVGNLIGVDVSGAAPLGNDRDGVIAFSADNLIGGSSASHRNVISANGGSGLGGHGIELGGSGATRNLVLGNLIGTDVTGALDRGNVGNGVYVQGPTNTIGGTSLGDRNVISGNGQDGVLVHGGGNRVRGNLIGTARDGRAALANAGNGVAINANGGGEIGGRQAGSGNTIAFNRAAGVAVNGGTGFAVLGNGIHSNAGLGIDLGFPGVLPNDPLDADMGPNLQQNFPELTAATTAGGTTTVRGQLSSSPGTTFLIQLFASPNCDGSGHGEGARPVDSFPVTTAGNGLVSFTRRPASAVPVGDFLTATATDPASNTSELSSCRRVAAG